MSYLETEARDERGRWTAGGVTAATAGAAVAGGAAGAGAAAIGLRRARTRAFGQAKAAVKPIWQAKQAVNTRLAARGARRDAAEASIAQRLKRVSAPKGWTPEQPLPPNRFLPTAIRGLRGQLRRTEAELRAHMASHAETFLDPDTGAAVSASTDAIGEGGLRSHSEALREQLTELQQKGSPRRTIAREGSTTQPKIDSFKRTRTGALQFSWRGADVQGQLDWLHANGRGEDVPKTTAALEARLRQIPQRHWRRYLGDLDLTTPRAGRPKVTGVVRNVARVIPAHTARLTGFPDAAGRKRLSEQITLDVSDRVAAAAARDRSAVDATWPVTNARYKARAGGALAGLRRLAALRQFGRAGIVGAGLLGAVAGGAAAYGGLRAWRSYNSPHRQPAQLGKAFEAAKHPRGDDGRWTSGGGVSPNSSFLPAKRDTHPTVTVLIGPPASGKSTWHQANRPDATLISTDAVIKRQGWPMTADAVDRALKIARQEFRVAAAAGQDIVLDRTNPTVKSRGRWLAKLPAGYRKEAVVFETHGLERAWRLQQRKDAGDWIDDPRLRYNVPTEAPAAGEFDAVETVKQGISQGAIAWMRRRRAASGTSKPLAKAAGADDGTPENQAKTVYQAGAAVEDTLANRLARMFGSWTQMSGERLADGGEPLRADLQSDLVRATQPLDTAARGGAAADVGVETADRDGRSRLITLTLDVGSSKVKAFSDDYRVKLAGDMAEEQLQTVQSVLQDATLQGQAPAVTARILRQTIGLTPYQASHVISFRRQLETLDPNVLGRALRDQRYDRTLNRALLEQDPLNDEQVDAMTDAYHRRYLAFRAMTIARTEGLRAANNGHAVAVEGFVDENPGFTVIKTWQATHDDRTRPDHRALDGQQVVGLQTPFVVPENGDQILWPHHPEAPLRQVVRCRCTFAISLVPRTAAAQQGFSLTADSPAEVA